MGVAEEVYFHWTQKARTHTHTFVRETKHLLRDREAHVHRGY